jgi:hypothetical protein
VIIAMAGEFLECCWEDDTFVGIDLHGRVRLRISWTGWGALTRIQRLTLVWDLCAVLVFPSYWHANATRRLDEPRPLPAEPGA